MSRYARLTIAEEHLQRYKKVARDYIRWVRVDRTVGSREDLLNDLIDAAHYRKLALEWDARVRRAKQKLIEVDKNNMSPTLRYMMYRDILQEAERMYANTRSDAWHSLKRAKIYRDYGDCAEALTELNSTRYYHQRSLVWASRVRKAKDKLWDAGIDLCIEECTKYLARKGYIASLDVLTDPDSTDYEISSVLHAYGFVHPEELLEASR